jgi:hypothetical protein
MQFLGWYGLAIAILNRYSPNVLRQKLSLDSLTVVVAGVDLLVSYVLQFGDHLDFCYDPYVVYASSQGSISS